MFMPVRKVYQVCIEEFNTLKTLIILFCDFTYYPAVNKGTLITINTSIKFCFSRIS